MAEHARQYFLVRIGEFRAHQNGAGGGIDPRVDDC